MSVDLTIYKTGNNVDAANRASINIKNNNFITNKKDKFMHGIGLKNIKDTVYKYNGEIKIEFDDDKFVIKFIFWPVMLIWYPVTHSVLNIKLKKCKFKL